MRSEWIRESAFHAFQQGNDDAFDLLFKHYFPILRSFIYHYLPSCNCTEDLASDSLIKLWNHRKKIKDVHSLEPYLFQIARNRCNDYLRQEKSRDRRHQVLHEQQKETNTLFEKSLIQSLLIEFVFQLSVCLPADSLKIIDLFYIKGLTDQEIANLMHLPRRTVQSRRNRAIVQLRQQIEKKDPLLLSP